MLGKACPCKNNSESSESSEESTTTPCNCDNFDVVAADLKRLRKLTSKILKVEALYDSQQQWLDAAQLGVVKVDRQVEQVVATKADLESELKSLRQEKKQIMNKAAATIIKRDMVKAESELARVTAEHERILEEKGELSEASDSLTKTILDIQKRMQIAKQAIKIIKKLPKV